MTVELIYDLACPNVSQTRSNLLQALVASGGDRHWREWDRMAAGSPRYARRYGSPTILVDGLDIAAEAAGEGAACCRLYGGAGERRSGVPSVALILSALERRRTPSR